jgi:hypothetical protein
MIAAVAALWNNIKAAVEPHESGRNQSRHSYLHAQTLSSLLLDSLRLFAENWRVLIAIYLPLTLILSFVENWLFEDYALGPVLGYFVYPTMAVLLSGPLTIAISEACLGWRPSFRRSFRRLIGAQLVGLAVAIVLQLTLVLAGYMVIATSIDAPWIDGLPLPLQALWSITVIFAPLLVFGAWYMFVQPSIIFENCGVFDSFRRSRYLGRGYCLRNLRYMLSVTIIFVVFYALISRMVDWIRPSEVNYGRWASLFETLYDVLPGTVVVPLVTIGLILLYYDLRIRKEGLEKLEHDLSG